MSVVRRESLRRWSLVSAGVAVLCLLPAAVAAVAAWPVAATVDIDPAELRERILASEDQPYQGYVATQGRLGLPPLPQLAEVSGLLGGEARIRAWYAAPHSWRVAELTLVGERDTYRTTAGRYTWDFERNLFALVAGESVIWLPGAADVVPPALARRLLATEGRLEPLPPRRVAGVGAAGVRLVPDDPETTVGRVDVWADPATGLPVQVEIAGRGGVAPAFTARFRQLRQATPDPAALAPQVPDRAGLAVITTAELESTLLVALPGRLPETLAGAPRASLAAAVANAGGGVYGTGLASMVVLGLPGRIGGEVVSASQDAGTLVPLPGAEAYELRASLLTVLVVHADHEEVDRGELHTWLLAGFVDPELLRQAATDLVGAP